jgi:hypothetical protein
MKFLRLTATLITAGALVVSCSRQDDELQAVDNNLLQWVPADTPYVFAHLQPVPDDILDAWMVRTQPFLDALQQQLVDARQDLQVEGQDVSPEFAAIADAVLVELDGKLNLAGLESLGFSLQANQVVYGNGLFPVARLGLGNAQALRDAIARVEERSGQTIPELELDGTSYWRIVKEENGMAAYISILAEHVAIGFIPMNAETEILPALLTQQKPEASLEQGEALARMNQEKGFTPYGSGYLDTRLALEEMLNPASRTAGYLSTVAGYDATTIDPVCAEEARLIASHLPRMVFGVTELTSNSAAVRYQAEIQRSLSGELLDLVSKVPPASTDTGNLFAGSLAVRFGRLRDFARDKAAALAAAPFACPQLKELNETMTVLAEQLNQPVPLPLGNVMGLRAVLSAVNISDPQPETSRGLLSLEVENPQMLIGAATMLIPGFSDLGIEPGAEPVKIPEELLSMVTPEFEVHAVQTRNAIGLAFGKDMRSGLVPFMEQDNDNDGVFLSFDYDMAALAELQGSMVDQSLDAEQLRLMEAYRAMLGRSRVEFRFTKEGLSIDSRTTVR